MMFDGKGMPRSMKWLSQAEKNETRPSQLKMSCFNKTSGLESTNTCDKLYLGQLDAQFDEPEYTLATRATLATDPKWYDPETEPTWNFVKCRSHSNITHGRLPPGFEGTAGYYRRGPTISMP